MNMGEYHHIGHTGAASTDQIIGNMERIVKRVGEKKPEIDRERSERALAEIRRVKAGLAKEKAEDIRRHVQGKPADEPCATDKQTP